MNPERRGSPRLPVAKLNYVHLEGDNGAIVLNASKTGFGFHAAGPIHNKGPIRFYVSLGGNRRTELLGEVMWTDESKKTGGIRLIFSAATAEALGRWLARLIGVPGEEVSRPAATVEVAQPTPSDPPDGRPAVPLPLTVVSAGSASALRAKVVELKRPEGFEADSSDPGWLRGMRESVPRTAKWASLAAAVLVAAIAFHGRLGSSLIGLGERLGGSRPAALAAAATQAAEAAGTTTRLAAPSSGAGAAPGGTTTAATSLEDLQREIEALDREYREYDAESEDDDARVERASSRGTQPATAGTTARKAAPTTAAATAGTATASTTAAGGAAAGNGAPFASAQPVREPSTARAGAMDTGLLAREDPDLYPIYFDVGSYKRFDGANEAADKLGQMGFVTTVVRKRLLWAVSFHVLVGPYGDVDRADAARAKLEPLGFRPRAARVQAVEALR